MATVAMRHAPDHGPGKRGILLASLFQSERHRDHPGDHGAASHDDGSKPSLGRGDGCAVSRHAFFAAMAVGEADQHDRIRNRDTHCHDRPHE